MCLIACAWQAHPRYALVLAGNRDEFHARPTTALACWEEADIIAGRDLEAGGTWMGVSGRGRACVVTNVRGTGPGSQGRSRGLLTLAYLDGEADAAAYANALQQYASDYRPFNLLLFDRRHGYYLGNRPSASKQKIAAGVHGVSNGDFNAPWPKTRALMGRLHGWIARDTDDVEPLFAALADESRAPDAELPDTGLGLARERALSPAFIRGAEYGTRASTVLTVDFAGSGWITERRYGRNGVFEGETRLQFHYGELSSARLKR